MPDPVNSDRIMIAERFIAAPPEKIFELVANPKRHPDIDGSGTVKQADTGGPDRLALGDRFGMAMKMGVPYRMVNVVTEFEENRRIAWAPKVEVLGKVIEGFAGRLYRYELEPRDGGTLVRETWDATREKGFFLIKLGGMPKKVKANLEATLAKIASIVE
jgi:uncharacterized protein YndB with AHSA1/START domain